MFYGDEPLLESMLVPRGSSTDSPLDDCLIIAGYVHEPDLVAEISAPGVAPVPAVERRRAA